MRPRCDLPARFWDTLHGDWPGVLRAKGLFWLATRLDRMAVWSQAGPVARIQGGNIWWAAVPESMRPDDDGFREKLKTIWDDSVGDCRQELVFIGIDIPEADLRKALAVCLLTDEEMQQGPLSWNSISDPMPTGP